MNSSISNGQVHSTPAGFCSPEWMQTSKGLAPSFGCEPNSHQLKREASDAANLSNSYAPGAFELVEKSRISTSLTTATLGFASLALRKSHY